MKHDQHKEKVVEILVVEDDPKDVSLLRETMRETNIGHHLYVVNDGELATDFLYRKGAFPAAPRPDLILLAIDLPKKNGLEVLWEIKTDPDLMLIPVIVLTTSKSEEDIFRTYDLNVSSFVRKPVQLSELLEMMKKYQKGIMHRRKTPK